MRHSQIDESVRAGFDLLHRDRRSHGAAVVAGGSGPTRSQALDAGRAVTEKYGLASKNPRGFSVIFGGPVAGAIFRKAV
ncbi:hypothetical protein C7E20_20140 [Sphingobium sp. AEW4]|nr:hypothetical protein C7E20_20140 [Sphingobium sp. AEW4]